MAQHTRPDDCAGELDDRLEAVDHPRHLIATISDPRMIKASPKQLDARTVQRCMRYVEALDIDVVHPAHDSRDLGPVGPGRGTTAHVRVDREAMCLGCRDQCALACAQRDRHRKVKTFEQREVPWRVVVPHLHEPTVVGDPALALEPERMSPEPTYFDAVGIEQMLLEGHACRGARHVVDRSLGTATPTRRGVALPATKPDSRLRPQKYCVAPL